MRVNPLNKAFDEHGQPVDAAEWATARDESRYSPDGTPFLTAG